jgi:outer membrane lipoprotein-sorting protein
MKKFIITLIVIATTFNLSVAFAQQDQKAKDVLNKLSEKSKSYKTIVADFTLKMINKEEDIDEEQSGTLYIKDNKYYVSIPGQVIFSDGKAVYTYLKDADEIQINNLPDALDEESVDPSKLFTLYEKDFKYKYVKEENNQHVINLYPLKPDGKGYHRITLYIDKSKMEISRIEIYGKDGTNTIYIVKSFKTNVPVEDSKFTYNKSKYPNAEVIDLRE